MTRITGAYQTTVVSGETVRSFVPVPLPPSSPTLQMDATMAEAHQNALAALEQLALAGTLVPSQDWFLYGFVRKEAVITSQLEGTQATLTDVLTFEATRKSDRPADVEEISNYVEALTFARREIVRPRGMPLCVRLLRDAHKRLMRGARGADKQPGEIRNSQNWIGGSRPGNARFVPPPPEAVPQALSDLEQWIHGIDPLPPLVRAGLAHAQFETIHPFLDGNGRIGRLLISLLVEHWGLLKEPLLYLSLAFKRHPAEYYEALTKVRTDGDWEGWTLFFLRCVREAALDGIDAARRLFEILSKARQAVLDHKATTLPAVRLLELLPKKPIVTLPVTIELLKTTKPTAGKAIDALCQAGILKEISGKKRDRVYAFGAYLKVLTEDTGQGTTTGTSRT